MSHKRRLLAVYAYEMLEPTLVVHLPVSAEVLCVKEQHGKCVLYVLQDTHEGHTVPRFFARYPTGATCIPDGVIARTYVGTCMMCGGDFVVHVFEEVR